MNNVSFMKWLKGKIATAKLLVIFDSKDLQQAKSQIELKGFESLFFLETG